MTEQGLFQAISGVGCIAVLMKLSLTCSDINFYLSLYILRIFVKEFFMDGICLFRAVLSKVFFQSISGGSWNTGLMKTRNKLY